MKIQSQADPSMSFFERESQIWIWIFQTILERVLHGAILLQLHHRWAAKYPF